MGRKSQQMRQIKSQICDETAHQCDGITLIGEKHVEARDEIIQNEWQVKLAGPGRVSPVQWFVS
jgi:hypothetical protein